MKDSNEFAIHVIRLETAMIKGVDSMKIPNMYKMRVYFRNYIQTNNIPTRNTGLLSKHATKCFTKLGKDMGFYVRAPNNFKDLPNGPHQYPNDGGLLDIDLVWITDNPHHAPNNTTIYNFDNWEKAKSEIELVLEFEATNNIVKDDLTHQCDELWKLSFVMARVKVLIYVTNTNEIDHHIEIFREAISNFGIRQQPNPEWRIFSINATDDTVIGKIITPLE